MTSAFRPLMTALRTMTVPQSFRHQDSWQRPPDKRCSLICTEKDALKLWRLHPDALAVPLLLALPPAFFAALNARLAARGYHPRDTARTPP